MIPAAAGLPAEVGRRITVLRRSTGLSLSELARRAGLGKGTLSELEAGRRNPTLETLYALTAPLGVGLASLIDVGGLDAPARGAVTGDGISAVLLDVIAGAGHSGVTEVYRLVIDAGARRSSPAHGPGVTERLTGVSGAAIVGPVGRQRRVGAGESVRWVSDVQHTFENIGDGPSVGVLVITHPAPGPTAADRRDTE